MCSFCGALGGRGHWSDSLADSAERVRERTLRLRLASRVLAAYGVKLAPFEGDAYAVTGKTPTAERADHLVALWPLVERVSGKVVDPLDPALVASLDALSDERRQ